MTDTGRVGKGRELEPPAGLGTEIEVWRWRPVVARWCVCMCVCVCLGCSMGMGTGCGHRVACSSLYGRMGAEAEDVEELGVVWDFELPVDKRMGGWDGGGNRHAAEDEDGEGEREEDEDAEDEDEDGDAQSVWG